SLTATPRGSRRKSTRTAGLKVDKAELREAPDETLAASSRPHPFSIVGIGASAGGFEAFSHLLGRLPADTGLAYVLVQHLDPTHESTLSELLSHSCPIPVFEA